MMDSKTFWLRSAGSSALFGAAMFVAMRLASADPGGRTRDELTFSGVLREADGGLANRSATLTIVFHKLGSTAVCAPTATATAVNGAFTASVSTSACAHDFFDGSDITYDVMEGTTALAMGVNVTPVPYARYADQAGVGNNCPAGYTLDPSSSPGTVCFRTVTLGAVPLRDEVVKVGTGSSAFWVDRYESAAHQVISGSQVGLANTTGGAADDIAGAGLPRNGQRPRGIASPVMALSHAGMPTVNITWFQANEACRAAGKRLPSGSEWLAAASGTDDTAACNVSTAGVRAAAPGNGCVSASGVHDMIGNVSELTDEWYASVGQVTSAAQTSVGAHVTGIRVNYGLTPWPTGYGGDATWNITSTIYNDAEGQIGIPSAALRGGVFANGPAAGVFALDLSGGPSNQAINVGFRCVVPH